MTAVLKYILYPDYSYENLPNVRLDDIVTRERVVKLIFWRKTRKIKKYELNNKWSNTKTFLAGRSSAQLTFAVYVQSDIKHKTNPDLDIYFLVVREIVRPN